MLANLFHPHDLHRLHNRLCVSLANACKPAKKRNPHRLAERLGKEFADPHQWPDKSERELLGKLVKNSPVSDALTASTDWLKACDLISVLVFLAVIRHRKMNLLHLREWMNTARNHLQIWQELNVIANELSDPYRKELQSLAERIGSDQGSVFFLLIQRHEIGQRGGASEAAGALHGYAVRCLAACVDDDVDAIAAMLEACGIPTSAKRVRSAIENRRRFRTKP